MKKLVLHVAVIVGLLTFSVGCGKNETAAPAQGMVTQGASSEAAATYADPILAELTREVRRWIVATKKIPASFEEVAAAAKLPVPPPPAGKKYALSKENRVILVDQKN
jgi:hypothetical protein